MFRETRAPISISGQTSLVTSWRRRHSKTQDRHGCVVLMLLLIKKGSLEVEKIPASSVLAGKQQSGPKICPLWMFDEEANLNFVPKTKGSPFDFSNGKHKKAEVSNCSREKTIIWHQTKFTFLFAVFHESADWKQHSRFGPKKWCVPRRYDLNTWRYWLFLG